LKFQIFDEWRKYLTFKIFNMHMWTRALFAS